MDTKTTLTVALARQFPDLDAEDIAKIVAIVEKTPDDVNTYSNLYLLATIGQYGPAYPKVAADSLHRHLMSFPGCECVSISTTGEIKYRTTEDVIGLTKKWYEEQGYKFFPDTGVYSISYLLGTVGVNTYSREVSDNLSRYLEKSADYERVPGTASGEVYYKATDRIKAVTRKWYEDHGWRLFPGSKVPIWSKTPVIGYITPDSLLAKLFGVRKYPLTVKDSLSKFLKTHGSGLLRLPSGEYWEPSETLVDLTLQWYRVEGMVLIGSIDK